VGLQDETWEKFKEEYVDRVVEEYAKPLVEDPRANSENNSSILDELPATFAICESRMNKLMSRNNNDNDDEENEDEQKLLLQNLITNLRESQDDEFDLEDGDHNYMSDSDEDEDDEDEEFPEIEFDPLQYASVRSQSLQAEEADQFDDRNFWNVSHVSVDTDELLRSL